MTRERFDCEELFRRLEDYVDRELSAEESALVEAHLAECEACAMEYEFEARFVTEVKKKLRQIQTPSDLVNRISRALRKDPPDTSKE